MWLGTINFFWRLHAIRLASLAVSVRSPNKESSKKQSLQNKRNKPDKNCTEKQENNCSFREIKRNVLNYMANMYTAKSINQIKKLKRR